MGNHADSTNIHIPYAWSYADAAARTGASGFVAGDVGKLALQEDDNSLWILTATTPTWVAVGGSGGGAPTDAEYITSAANGSLSAEVVIPGLAGSADIAGAGGAGVAYEFDSGASPLTWTAAVDAEDVDTTVKSHLYVQDNGAAETLGLYSWAPAGAFDIRCKILIGIESGSTSAFAGLVVTDSGNSNRVLIGIVLDTGATPDALWVKAYTYASSSYTQRGQSFPIHATEAYIRIVRDGSNNISFYVSSNGILWQLIATQAFTFTVANAGLRLAPASAVTNVAVDWIRSNV